MAVNAAVYHRLVDLWLGSDAGASVAAAAAGMGADERRALALEALVAKEESWTGRWLDRVT